MCAGAGLMHLRQQTCAECVCGCARDVGWDKDDVWFAHCCMLDKAETQQFASCGIGIAHCPSSNMRLASGIAPVASYLDAGVSCSITPVMAGVYSQPLGCQHCRQRLRYSRDPADCARNESDICQSRALMMM